MKVQFHQKTVDLLDVQPKFSGEVNTALMHFEDQSGVELPISLREWYCIESSDQLFRQIAEPHEPAAVMDMTTWMKTYSAVVTGQKMLPILFENQGVWHMTIPLEVGENPPVYIGYYEESFEWKLHAKSFTDCIYAFAWDYMIMQNDYQLVKRSTAEKGGTPKKKGVIMGPETQIANAWFVFSRYYRYQEGNLRKTEMVHEHETWILASQVK
jgi:hypothetical protein